jgi:hypothetical protein
LTRRNERNLPVHESLDTVPLLAKAISESMGEIGMGHLASRMTIHTLQTIEIHDATCVARVCIHWGEFMLASVDGQEVPMPLGPGTYQMDVQAILGEEKNLPLILRKVAIGLDGNLEKLGLLLKTGRN